MPPPEFDGAGVSVACAVSRGTDVEVEDADDVVVDGGAVVDDSDVSLVTLDSLVVRVAERRVDVEDSEELSLVTAGPTVCVCCESSSSSSSSSSSEGDGPFGGGGGAGVGGGGGAKAAEISEPMELSPSSKP
jgi:uncharacterized membrane protein YgcG